MVVLAIFILAAEGIAFYSFGIFLRPLTIEFDWDRGALSAAFSMMMLINGGLAILAGRLADRYGPRLLLTVNGLLTGAGFLLMSRVSSLGQVYLIWGLLVGIAFSCGFIPVTSAIARWFIKKRGIALGLTVAGYGLGGIIAPTLSQWLISSYGWRQAYVILGLVILIIVIPLAQFMQHNPQRTGFKPYGENENITIDDKHSPAVDTGGLSFIQAIQSGRFWIFGFVLFGFMFSFGLIIVHIAPYAVDVGILAMVAASIVSIIGGTSIIGRFSTGFISDKIGARRVLTACLGMLTLALVWLLFAKGIWGFYIFAVIFGIAYGGIIPMFTLVPAELFGLKFLGIISATAALLGTIGGAIGAPVGGSIFDITRSYSLALLICVVIGALALILSLILLKAEAWHGDNSTVVVLKA